MDTRTADTIFIRTRAIGVATGGTNAAPNQAMRRVAAAATQFLDSADDIRKSLAGPAQRGQLIAERSGPLIKAINEAAKEIATHCASVVSRMRTPVFTDWTKTTPPYHEAAISMEIAKRHFSASPADRHRLIGAIVAEPAEHLDAIRALVTVPRVVSGLSANEVGALGTLAFQAMRPDEYAALEVEQQQVGIAARAVAVAVDICKDAGADVSQLSSLAPDATALLKTDVPRWPDVRAVLHG